MRRPPIPILPLLCIAAIAILPAAIAFAPCIGLRCASPLPTSQARRPPSLTRILALDAASAAAALSSTHAAAKRLILDSVALVRPRHPLDVQLWRDWVLGIPTLNRDRRGCLAKRGPGSAPEPRHVGTRC